MGGKTNLESAQTRFFVPKYIMTDMFILQMAVEILSAEKTGSVKSEESSPPTASTSTSEISNLGPQLPPAASSSLQQPPASWPGDWARPRPGNNWEVSRPLDTDTEARTCADTPTDGHAIADQLRWRCGEGTCFSTSLSSFPYSHCTFLPTSHITSAESTRSGLKSKSTMSRKQKPCVGRQLTADGPSVWRGQVQDNTLQELLANYLQEICDHGADHGRILHTPRWAPRSII